MNMISRIFRKLRKSRIDNVLLKEYENLKKLRKDIFSPGNKFISFKLYGKSFSINLIDMSDSKHEIIYDFNKKFIHLDNMYRSKCSNNIFKNSLLNCMKSLSLLDNDINIIIKKLK